VTRDMDLVRTLLIALEQHPDAAGPCEELIIGGHSSDEVSYHVKLLYQAGLIEATDLSGGGDTLWFPGALTWAVTSSSELSGTTPCGARRLQ
jgi:hypothetical protein